MNVDNELEFLEWIMVVSTCLSSLTRLRSLTLTFLKGIKHQLTIAYTPEQNGVAERMNRSLMESARAMISHANLPNSFWAEAVATAVYLRNRSESSALKEDLTPYEIWYGRKHDVSHLRVFGCIAYSHIPDSQCRKLDKKAQKY